MARGEAPKYIRKRDGSVVPFDREKIERAVRAAAFEVLQDTTRSVRIGSLVADRVIRRIVSSRKKSPTVEAVQDMVETALMEQGYDRIAKAYILYREKRSDLRLAKSALGLKDDLKLPLNAMEVLRRRYLLKDDQKNIIETPSELFRRVAVWIAQGERNFKSSISEEEAEERFYQMMRSLEFMPNSPTLMNAGTALGQLSACFVIPVEDSIEGIFEALKDMARIHQTGGGTGFSFSRLRPRGDLVASTKGEASGPVSFMDIFDRATGVIVQGGRRRGANMGILRCDHPDIVDFIEAKLEKDRLSNFNLSVGVTDKFMEAVIRNESYDWINPRTGKRTRAVKARPIFDLITRSAWRTGDPGMIFLDEVNRRNPTPGLGQIEATNPCGELPLLPYESCNLASINLSRMIDGEDLDWKKLKERIHWGIRFLDDVIEVNRFPLPEIRQITLGNRKIGLGIMGFADTLIQLRIPYGSQRAVQFAEKLMRFFRRESLRASIALAEERGVFPNFRKSVYAGRVRGLRNATVNTIAPTGTISMISGCSSGIEPLFAIAFVRNVLSGTRLFEIHPLFEALARAEGFYNQEILGQIAQLGSLQSVRGIPRAIKRIFATAFDVSPKQHVQVQAAFQRYTDNSVSKTINLPAEITPAEIGKIYLLAYRLNCKGITVYRYGTKEEQVLSFGYRKTDSPAERSGPIAADPEYSGGCAGGVCPF